MNGHPITVSNGSADGLEKKETEVEGSPEDVCRREGAFKDVEQDVMPQQSRLSSAIQTFSPTWCVEYAPLLLTDKLTLR